MPERVANISADSEANVWQCVGLELCSAKGGQRGAGSDPRLQLNVPEERGWILKVVAPACDHSGLCARIVWSRVAEVGLALEPDERCDGLQCVASSVKVMEFMV
jgi:hypothetical protein